MKISIIILVCLSVSVSLRAEAAFHVAVTGADTNAGTEAAPLATVSKAAALVNETGALGEIVIHEGRYREGIDIRQPSTNKLPPGAVAPPLLIRPADGAKVVFDGSVLVTNAGPYEGHSNVFLVKGAFPGRMPPDIWEEDTRIRYTKAADVKSVASFPNSIVVLNKEIMALSTSDGASPGKHVVRYSIPGKNTGCFISRDNTTVRGISFENWSSVAIDARGSNAVAEDCSAFNCYLVFNGSGRDNRCIRCIGREVGSGAYSGGTSNVIEHCRFFAARGAFGFELYSQNDTGIQFYSPANGGTVRFNLCEGFQNGIFCKAVSGTFLMEHNTCVALNGRIGFYLSNWKPGSIVRQNIIYGFINAILSPDYLEAGGVFDENLFWNPAKPEKMKEAFETPLKFGTGKYNRIEDPRFVDSGKGDYRLARGMTLGDAEGPAGAMPFLPRFRLFPREKSEDGWWLKIWRQVGPDSLSGRHSEERRNRLLRPTRENNNQTANISAPVLIGSPRIRTNTRGAVLFIDADRPVFCSVEVRPKGSDQWGEIQKSLRVQHEWDQSMAGNVWPIVQIPSTNHVIALTGGMVDWIQPTKTNSCRIKLKDPAGKESVSELELLLAGEPEIFYVTVDGSDADGRGSREKPFATLQYALDQALPGDTVRLLPGVHLGASLFHGGAKDAPITIEAEKPGMAILDSMKRIPILLYLEKAPWVVIRNLELRWFLYMGIMAHQSSNVTVSHCRVWNGLFSSWIEGTGIWFFESPYGTVDHTTAFHLENGIALGSSPGARITYNTSACNMYGGLNMIYSSSNTVVHNNVFCFNGITGVGIEENAKTNNPEAIAALDLDYNNYAAKIRAGDMGNMTPEENLVPKHKSCQESKFIIGCGHVKNLAKLPPPYTPFCGRFFTLESWKESSGKDANSIYADPLFVNPAHHRFDVEKDSPNIGAGENGSTIGAEGWLGTETENEFRGEYFIIKFKNNVAVESFAVFNFGGGYNSYSKDFRIYLSEDGVKYTKVTRGTLKNVTDAQQFKITPQKAQYVKLYICSGYAEYHWELAEFEAYSSAGVNVACETNGAELIKFTSELNQDYWQAKNINDGKTNTFWASARDPEPVE